ncbi:40138_t:CDS:2 [Gigaspora margarita]|uniref:40138_t:CDS:1 n=1 Tax=Gigaspora margarita TaxID=4874 RepID=A0ABN7VFT7_GIGMA|nr:40138_t:CDS:2 [Gigaspora margarita]
MVLNHIEIIKPKPEQNYLTEFIKQIKQILQNPEQFEICDTKLDSIKDQYYLIIDNNDPYPLNLLIYESFTNSSREACRDSKESSILSLICSNNTSILSLPCASPNSLCSNHEFEELVFVNLNADHFSKAGNTNSGIRPDGQLICESIFPRFCMEVGSLESSKPANSSFNKKKSDKAKLTLAMLMFGAHVRNDFDPLYMSQSIQKLLKEIGYVTLQVYNENLIAQIYDFTYSPIKVRQILIDVLIPVRPTVRIGLAILWNAESLIRFLVEIKKLQKFLEKIDANFELLINRLDNKAPLEPLISREKFYQKFIHLRLFEILARWSAISEYYKCK